MTVAEDRSCSKADGGRVILSPFRNGVLDDEDRVNCDVHFNVECAGTLMVGQ